jgi:hypothetical protein
MSELTHTVSVVDEHGHLQPMQAPMDMFLECSTTHSAVLDFLVYWDNESTKDGAPVWVNTPTPGAGVQPALSTTTPPASTYATLSLLLAAPMLAQAHSTDAKMHYMVNKENEGWAHALCDHTRAAGEKALSFGGGTSCDETKTKENHTAVPLVITDDKTQVFYKKDTTEVRSSIYGLVAQLALEGKPGVKVNYHTMSTPADGISNGRFSIEPNRKKHYLCRSPRTLQSQDGHTQDVEWHQLARYVPMNNLPNTYLNIGWDMLLEVVSGVNSLQFDRPHLVWTKPMTFRKDEWFRWA